MLEKLNVFLFLFLLGEGRKWTERTTI